MNCDDVYITIGNWTGVKLGLLLEEAGLTEPGLSLVFTANDGYSRSMPYSVVLRDDVIVAYEKDGKSLKEVTRLVIPNANGDQWVSDISQIQVTFQSGSLTSIFLR